MAKSYVVVNVRPVQESGFFERVLHVRRFSVSYDHSINRQQEKSNKSSGGSSNKATTTRVEGAATVVTRQNPQKQRARAAVFQQPQERTKRKYPKLHPPKTCITNIPTRRAASSRETFDAPA